MQTDHLSYFNMMALIEDKRKILRKWTFQSPTAMGDALLEYLDWTESGTFGAFKITIGDRQKMMDECHEYIVRLIEELDKRFTQSVINENLSVLFDPQYLLQHKQDIDSNEYGRSALTSLRKKYKDLEGFDSDAATSEWQSLKPGLSDFTNHLRTGQSMDRFWKDFIMLKQSTNILFNNQFKNILILLGVYLIAPTNSVECERGVSHVMLPVIRNFLQCCLDLSALVFCSQSNPNNWTNPFDDLDVGCHHDCPLAAD